MLGCSLPASALAAGAFDRQVSQTAKIFHCLPFCWIQIEVGGSWNYQDRMVEDLQASWMLLMMGEVLLESLRL